MVYIIDDPLSPFSRSFFLFYIIQEFTESRVNLFSIDVNSIDSIKRALNQALNLVESKDVVLLAWSIPKNAEVDALVERLTEKCSVIATVGQTLQDISTLTPARLEKVIAVGCRDANGGPAFHSNYSADKEIRWVPATPYKVAGRVFDNCSVSGAVYAGILAEAIRKGNPLLVDFYVKAYTEKIAEDALQTVTFSQCTPATNVIQ